MRVLIVDDSPTARAQARQAVEAISARLLADPSGTVDVDEANDGTDALRVLSSSLVDLLIVDLHMPMLSGLDVLSFWRKRAPPGSRAVLVTTGASAVDRQRAKAMGNVGFAEKPLSDEGLLEALAFFPG
jgi:CheY-like chemotaxis protein